MGIITANSQVFKYSVKKMMQFFVFAFCILGFAFSASSQSKKAQAFYKDGSEHLHWDRFDEAEASFLQALKIEPKYTAAREKLAFTYIQSRQYENAYVALVEVAKTEAKPVADIFYALAKLSLATSRFDEGLSYLDQYLKSGNPSGQILEQTKVLNASLLFGKNYHEKFANVPKAEVKPLNPLINTPAREYFPTMTADGDQLFFSRMVKGGNNIGNEDIYVSAWADTGWAMPQSVSPNINTANNEAAATISPDGRKLFFTICESPKNYGTCDIWVSTKVGDVWMAPENIGPKVNSKGKQTQPCLSGDGHSLYFVSNRKGGIGQLDIWVSHLQPDGKWGEPENLGPAVNTPFDEQRPFIHPDNHTLYFSSNGHPGFGNADIFLSAKNAKKEWQEPVNLGLPINSYENDEGIFVSLDGTTGYFTSDRFHSTGKKGDFDIYSFRMHKAISPNAVAYVKGVVFDENNNRVAAEIEFIDLNSKVVVNKTISDEQNGSYLLTLISGRDYAMNISKPGYLFYSKNFSLENIKPGTSYKLNAYLKKIRSGEKAVLNNIFFETNSAELKHQSLAELEILTEFMQENPTVKIEIEGHTDNTGAKEYNQQLSEKRAKAVYDYLLDKGIPAPRLSFKGYGQTQPLAPNDSEEGKAQNRRTEFKIISN